VSPPVPPATITPILLPPSVVKASALTKDLLKIGLEPASSSINKSARSPLILESFSAIIPSI
jgi:hypothetical protein